MYLIQPTSSLPNIWEPETPIQPFDFQRDVIKGVVSKYQAGIRRALVIAGCGVGKTIISSSLIRDYVAKGLRCLFLVHRSVLLSQTRLKMECLGVRATIVQGKRWGDPTCQVFVASLQTVKARLNRGYSVGDIFPDFDLIVVDEAHDTAFHEAYEAIADYYWNRGAHFLGLTATPWRTKSDEYLGLKFDATVAAPQAQELIRIGRSVPNRCYGFGIKLDVSKLKIGRDGDYDADQLGHELSGQASLDCVVEQYKRFCVGRPTVGFGVTIAHIKAVQQAFLDAGVRCEIQTGATHKDERDRQDARLRSGECEVLLSCGTLGVGWDEPCVSAMMMLYPTLSKSAFFQRAGRAARVYPGKVFYYLLDFGDNTRRHGNPEDDQDFYIGPKKASKQEEQAKYKSCLECDALVPIAAKKCPYCGHEFASGAREEDDAIEEVNEDLVEKFTGAKKTQRATLKAFRVHYFLNGLTCAPEELNRFDPDVIKDGFANQFGFWPPDDWYEHLILGPRPSEKKTKELVQYLSRFERGDEWIDYHLKLEGVISD